MARASPFRRFGRADDGVAAIEFALIAPLLVFLLFGCLTIFVLYRDSYRTEDATFTVADILARETSVSATRLDTAYAMFLKMLPPHRTGATFRVSSIKKDDDEVHVDWSYPVAPLAKLTDGTIPLDKLPLIQNGDSVILVETSVGYSPVTGVLGLGDGSYTYVTANRPRFTAAVVWAP